MTQRVSKCFHRLHAEKKNPRDKAVSQQITRIAAYTVTIVSTDTSTSGKVPRSTALQVCYQK
jgi:hypothetical protein